MTAAIDAAAGDVPGAAVVDDGAGAQGYFAFVGSRRLATGDLVSVALAAQAAVDADPTLRLSLFDGEVRVVDLDLRGDADSLRQRLSSVGLEADGDSAPTAARGRGRPKLGVVAREVTLLPRHWAWLAAQPGGASVALRKLVEAARRLAEEPDQRRQRQERAYRFMSSLAGDLPGYEEACRALFADDAVALARQVQAWPTDLRSQTLILAGAAGAAGATASEGDRG